MCIDARMSEYVRGSVAVLFFYSCTYSTHTCWLMTAQLLLLAAMQLSYVTAAAAATCLLACLLQGAQLG
jgi:hypothetical protein